MTMSSGFCYGTRHSGDQYAGGSDRDDCRPGLGPAYGNGKMDPSSAQLHAFRGVENVGGRSFMGLDVGPGGSNRPKVLGIIGFGRIGQAVMRRSRGFKMKVIAYDPS